LIRQKYQKRLENFLDFLGMSSEIVEDKYKSFFKRIKKNRKITITSWIFNGLLKFLQLFLNRVNRKKIIGITVRYISRALRSFAVWIADILTSKKDNKM